jgi:putative hydrolase of the HAD superfamily
LEKVRRIISFDVDGTLVKPEFNDLIWREVIPELYARKNEIEIEAAKEFIEGEYDKIGEYDLRWYSLDFWLDYFRLDVREKEILGEYAGKVSLYADVLSTLEELSKNYQLVIASCMGNDFIDIKLRKRNIKKYFKRVFSAVSIGLIKKEGSFYLALCSSLAIKPNELIHIGDHYEFDYLVPREIGIRAFYLDRNNGKQKVSLDEVKSLHDFTRCL